MLLGRTLMIVPDQLIVQSWQASSWKKNDTDSVLDLQFDRVKMSPSGMLKKFASFVLALLRPRWTALLSILRAVPAHHRS